MSLYHTDLVIKICYIMTTTTNAKSLHFIYLFILFILSLMLTITEQILFTIKNSSKMLIDVNTLVKSKQTNKKLLNIKHFI